MANIIKLVKCDQRIFQGRIEEVRLVVESVAVKVFLLSVATSLGCMTAKIVVPGVVAGVAAIAALVAYGYSQNLARFIVLDLEKREVLTLAVMPKPGQEANNF